MSEVKGAFLQSLVRNNRKIKEDRAIAIGEDAEIRFKRVVEDLEIQIKRMKRERDNMLDLSPNNAMSLMVANDFDSSAFCEKDLELGVAIRNLEIKHEIAANRYKELFRGEETTTLTEEE